jgi:HEAT repeat protein
MRLYGYLPGSIALAVGKLGERSMMPGLVRMLANIKQDGNGIVNIADSVGDPEGDSAVPDLVHLLSDKQLDANVRELIIECLGNFGERSVIPDLMRLLTKDNLDEEVTVSLISGAVNQCIIVMPRGMRVGIAYALGNLGERSVVPDLIHLLTNDRLNVNVHTYIYCSCFSKVRGALSSTRTDALALGR